MYDAEALRVAKTPLVIIEQRPSEVPAEIDPLTKSRMRRAQVRPIVGDTERIVDSAIDRLRRIVKRGAVLGDVKRDATIALRHPLERLGESVGVYFPAGLRVRVPRLVDASHAQRPRRRVASRHAASVVVHAD